MKESLRSVGALLTRRIGLDPNTVGEGLIRRAIVARMAALGIAEPGAYARLVASSELELGELIEVVVVPESWFFRDAVPFELFVRSAAPAGKPLAAAALRVLSVPCARGEEPYSIAMALLDAGFSASRIHIDAADLSAQALAFAARGVYGQGAFRGNDLAFRDRYFRAEDGRYALDESVCRLVRFQRANLTDPGFFAGAAPYDAIFCRNLLIYFDAEARRRALDNVDRLLTPEGLLFVGHAEAAVNLDARFVPIDEEGCFAYQRARMLPPPHIAVNAPAERCLPAPVKRSIPRPHTVERPAPVPGPPPRSLLEQAHALANERRHAEAIRLCERAIHQNGPSADAYLLLGMIHQSAGAIDQAEAALGKVVYLDPTHDEALLSLALLADRRGDARSAASFRRRAERARRAKEAR